MMKIWAFLPLSLALFIASCSGRTNPIPVPEKSEIPASFFRSSDGLRLQIFRFQPNVMARTTVYLAPGITGMNCDTEGDVFQALAGAASRVVAIFPRGTGFSEGTRGDIPNMKIFVDDFVGGIRHDQTQKGAGGRIILFGHSMSCTIAMVAARKLDHVDGLILVNPPFRRKPAPGMSPTWAEYGRYIGYLIFAPRAPIVNMSGDPERISDPQERSEAAQRSLDPVLVRYFSMRAMLSVQGLLKEMPNQARNLKVPLLLIQGREDSIVDATGSVAVFEAWNHSNKQYLPVAHGTHGKQTVLLAKQAIQGWNSRL
jgi:pimeloyl-ACP methyl ester carboxylesterase